MKKIIGFARVFVRIILILHVFAFTSLVLATSDEAPKEPGLEGFLTGAVNLPESVPLRMFLAQESEHPAEVTESDKKNEPAVEPARSDSTSSTEVESKESPMSPPKEEKTPAKPAAKPETTQDLLKSAAEDLKSGDANQALEKYKTAATKAGRNDMKTAAAAFSGIARCLDRLGNEAKAVEFLEKSVQMYASLKNAQARSLDLALLGHLLVKMNKCDAALKKFDEAQKILPASEISELTGILDAQVKCYVSSDKIKDALIASNKLSAAFIKSKKTEEAAQVNLKMAEMLLQRNQTKEAKSRLIQAERIYKDAGNSEQSAAVQERIAKLEPKPDESKPIESKEASADQAKQPSSADQRSGVEQKPAANSESKPAPQEEKPPANVRHKPETVDVAPFVSKGMTELNEGKLPDAVKHFSSALAACEKNSDRGCAAKMRLLIAEAELDRSRTASALESAGKSLEAFRALNAPSGESGALTIIAEIYYRQGFLQKALEYLHEAHSAAKKSGDRNRKVPILILFSDIHLGTGDYEAAAKFLKEAVDDARGGLTPRNKGELKLGLARFRLARESSDKALADALDAKKDFEEIGYKQGIADSDSLLGMVYELRGERQKAIALLSSALKLHEQIGDRFGAGRDLTAIGVHYKNFGELEKAIEHFKNAVDIRQGIGDLRGQAACLANLGNIYRHRSEIPEALQYLEQALGIYKRLSDKKGEADILTNLANLDVSRGSQVSAIEKFQAALKLHREISDTRGIATDLAGLGSLYLARGDYRNAAASLEEAEKINKKIRNPRGDILILSELAMLQRSKGNPGQALTLLNQALESAKQANEPAAVNGINFKMATVLEDLGDYPKALGILQNQLSVMKKQGDRKGEFYAIGGIGIIQTKMEDFEPAVNNLQKALSLAAELGLPAAQTRDLDFHFGEIYEGFRDFERALEHYQKAASSSQTSVGDTYPARIYDRIGEIYFQLEDYAKAKEYFEDAFRIHSENNDIQKQKTELIKLGDIMSKLGQSETSLKYLQRGLTLAKETGDRRLEAKVLTRMGTLQQILGRGKQALDSYKESYEIRQTLGDKRGVSENLLQIALITATLGEFDSAVNDLKKAFEIAQCSEDRSLLWKAYFIMGRALESKNRLGESLESYRKALGIVEAMDFETAEESDEDSFIFGGRSALYDTSLRVLMKLSRRDPEGAYENQALRIVEKLKASEFENTLSRINVDKFSDLPQELLLKEKSLKLNIRKLNAKLHEETSSSNADQKKVQKLLEDRRTKEKQFVALKSKLQKEYPAYAGLRYPQPVSVPELQKDVLDPDEAILQFMVTRSRTYIFALDKQRFYTYSVEYADKDLERDVEALTRPLHRADTQSSWDPSVAYKLYSKIIYPVEGFLIGKKTVVIIPHGPLSAVPFEILVDSKAHANKRFWSAQERPSYLVEKYAFSYCPSIAVLSQTRTRDRKERPGWNLAAFGDAVYQVSDKKKEANPGSERILASLTSNAKDSRNSELKQLPGARREISEITRILGGPTQTYLGDDATESLFKKVDLTRYNYIHLATHGVLLGNFGKLQQQPAVVFSLYGDNDNDGFLQLGEIFGLKLNSELVVLSSCFTHSKPPQGDSGTLLGLARAFLFAGTDSIIFSMWQVNDESTAKLFIEMYKNMREGTKAEALKNAKISLINSPGTAHPYYWAPFILMGNWNVRFGTHSDKDDSTVVKFKGISTWRKLLSM